MVTLAQEVDGQNSVIIQYTNWAKVVNKVNGYLPINGVEPLIVAAPIPGTTKSNPLSKLLLKNMIQSKSGKLIYLLMRKLGHELKTQSPGESSADFRFRPKRNKIRLSSVHTV